jgi:hypothetical protein
VGEESLRDYGSIRAASVRPAYEVARDYGTRMSSVRPEVPVREYGAGVGLRNETASRGYSVVPEGPPQAIRREFGVQSGEQQRYYGHLPLPGNDEVVYLDHPPQGYRPLR